MLHFYYRIFEWATEQTIWFLADIPRQAPLKHPNGPITDFTGGGFACCDRVDRVSTAAKVQYRHPNCGRGFSKLFSRIPSTALVGAVSGSGVPHRRWRLHLLATGRFVHCSGDNHSVAFPLQRGCLHRRNIRMAAPVSYVRPGNPFAKNEH